MHGNGSTFDGNGQGRGDVAFRLAASHRRDDSGVRERSSLLARIDALRSLSIFENSSDDSLAALAEAASLRRFGKGRRLSHGGAQDDCVILLKGRAKMCTPRGRSDGELVLEIFEVGDVLSESCWIRRERIFAGEVIALESSAAVFLPRLAIENFFEVDGELAIELLERIATRLARTSTLAAQNSCMQASDRLYCRLSELAVHRGRNVDEGLLIEHGLTQRELAAFCSASREIINRLLGDWRDRGWVLARRHAVLVRDVSALSQAVSPEARRVGFGCGDGRNVTRR